MTRVVLHTLVIAILALLSCKNLGITVSAQPIITSTRDLTQSDWSSIANLALHLIARAPDPQSDPAAGAGTGTGVTPDAAPGTTTPSGSGSNQALVGALVVLGLIFAGFILYFAW
ncbi:hypothetical protein FRC07_007118, partial [Ceratobasidium sp. 392]